jgi:CRISPR/Cas system CSM-associated protein Csm3 (group 7 of RAMP superfamily)
LRTEHISIAYRLTFTAAFHFGTGLRGGLIHRLVARDVDDFLYVPGSTLKGVLRDRCEQLAQLFDIQIVSPHLETWAEVNPDPDIVARIFGTRFHPGRLYFDDAQMIETHKELFKADTRTLEAKYKAWQTEQRTQVSMSRLTRTAQPGMLYTSEYGVRDLHFEGHITGMLEGAPLPNLDVGTYPLLLLVAGLLSLDRLGGNKSAGAGKASCEIADQEVCIDRQPFSVAALLEELPYLDEEFYSLWREEAEG